MIMYKGFTKSQIGRKRYDLYLETCEKKFYLISYSVTRPPGSGQGIWVQDSVIGFICRFKFLAT